MQKKYANVILSGSISIDRIMNFEGRYKDLVRADKLHVLSLSVLIDNLTHSRGGVATNIAYNLALLGDPSVVLGAVGSDANDYIADLAKLGVDTSHIHFSSLTTSTYTVLTDLDNNQVGGFYPGAMTDISNLTLKPWYGTKSLVVISAYDPLGMDQLVTECIDHKIDYVYDVGQQVTNITVDQLKHGLSGASILFVNDYELGAILGRTGYTESELNQIVPIIVTTLGAKGTKITGSSLESAILIEALTGVEVVDPTGAGDSYRAGFLYGYNRNWDLKSCAQLASVVASYTISLPGTQTHTFTLADLDKKHYSAYGTHLPK